MENPESYLLSDTDYPSSAVDRAHAEELRWQLQSARTNLLLDQAEQSRRRAENPWPTRRASRIVAADTEAAHTSAGLGAWIIFAALVVGAMGNEVIHAIYTAWMLHGGIH